MDGESKEAVKIIDKFKNVITFAAVTIKHGGACRARNEGASIATGDILSFFNSDYVAVPGMVRAWMEAFEDNPDCDFVYGGYGYIDPQKNAERGEFGSYFPSEDFDEYKLECYNYIDCASPIKKEIFQKWNESCKSLQDWDFFLRLVKAGAKGKYIKDILFAAELPRPKGLSDDSSHNWIERVKYVKKNNGVPERDICVTSVGAPLHAINTAKLLGADFKGYSVPVNFKPHNYKAIYLIGCYTGKDKNFSNLSVFRGATKECVKIIHWVGADIYWLRNLTFEEVKFLMPKMKKQVDYHLVECEQMRQEMADYGLETKIVPIAPIYQPDILPLPDTFSVAIMKTEKSDFDKYCGDLMDEVMAALPNINFKVFGDGKCKRNLANVENMGYVKMEAIIPRCSAFLRIVRHDGMMMAANQFVMAGRVAITNLKMPYMEYIDTQVNKDNWDKFGGGFNAFTYPETKAKIIEKILEVKETSKPKMSIADGVELNWTEEGSKYYRDLLNKEKFKKEILSLCERKS
jgi:hypothetical protein